MSLATALKKTRRSIERAVTGEEPKMDILNTLKEEHEQVDAMLKRMAASESGPERKSLLKQIRAALVPHLRGEEKILYKALVSLREKSARQHGEEGYIEHGLADRILTKLSKMSSATSPEFGAAAKVLKELIEHHVREEENALWSDARKHFSTDQRQAMNAKYMALKKTVRQ